MSRSDNRPHRLVELEAKVVLFGASDEEKAEYCAALTAWVDSRGHKDGDIVQHASVVNGRVVRSYRLWGQEARDGVAKGPWVEPILRACA